MYKNVLSKQSAGDIITNVCFKIGVIIIQNMDYVVHDNVFTRIEIEQIFNDCEGKTLGMLDRAGVFAKALANPKITGIAGDVVEQSILGMKANSKQEPDLVIDGTLTELKTTGLRLKDDHYEPKEPVSITAVSIDKIVNEDDFHESLLWHKLCRILFIYYHYNSKVTVKALGYKEFEVLSHQFYEPSALDRARYESDWTIVRNFLQKAKASADPEAQYPLLSTNINPELVVLDTAPKYPHPPRFRIKRAYFASIVKRHFDSKAKLETLDDEYVSYKELDTKLHDMQLIYKDKSVGELVIDLEIHSKKLTKQISEQIIVRMFGGKSKKLSKVELFDSFGITGYSIALSIEGKRTEDTKMCPIDFDEVMEDKPFEESDFYKYYHDNTFLFFVLQETQKASSKKGEEVKIEFAKNKFLGFKRIHFSDDFIYENVKPVWEKIRYLISSKTLREEQSARGLAPNFPKSSEGTIFVRGTGTDIYDKPLNINGIQMYRQNLWIRGEDLVNMLGEKDFI